jgi:hypothetical protein
MYDTLESQMSGSYVNFEAQQAVTPQLSHGERLLWAGRPRQGIFFQPQDVFMVPFSIAWGGFAIFWTYTAWRSGAPIFFVLWGTPFVAIGLYMMVGRFFSDAKARAKTFYAVTDQRILFVRGDSSSRQMVTSIDLKTVGDISFGQNPDGRGSITFTDIIQMPRTGGRGQFMVARSSTSAPAFVQIERVKDVYDQIRRAKDAVTK